MVVATSEAVCGYAHTGEVIMSSKHEQNLRERIEVLQAKRHNLVNRIRATEMPGVVEEHAQHLERVAEEIFDNAQKIRQSLKDDIEKIVDLRASKLLVDIEIDVCESCIRRNMRPGLGQSVESFVRSIVLTLLNRANSTEE